MTKEHPKGNRGTPKGKWFRKDIIACNIRKNTVKDKARWPKLFPYTQNI